MKKTISILAAICMTVTMLTPVYAESTAVSEVLANVKQRIPDTSEYTEFNSNVSEYDNGTYYNFSWSTDDGNKSMEVRCTADGVITSYSYDDSESDDYGDKFNAPSYDEAYDKAVSLCNALNPGMSDRIRVEKSNTVERLYDGDFSFSLKRYES